MGNKSKIEQLPGDVIHALNKRLIDSAFSDFSSHAEWLKENGHPVSIQSIHRYSQNLRNGTVFSIDEETHKRNVDLRMRCLEVASAVDSNSDPIEAANKFFFWVTTGRLV